MKKVLGGPKEYCKHSRNATRRKTGRRMTNKRMRGAAKRALRDTV